MENWFECKIKYEQVDEYGKEKPVSESYMVDALSFTEAEGRLLNLLKDEVPADFLVTGITKSKLDEIVYHGENEYWYKAKVIFKDVDEKSGKEKKIGNQILVQADGFRGALDHLEANLKEVLVPWEIQGISLTKVVEVFPYDANEKEIEGRNLRKMDEGE